MSTPLVTLVVAEHDNASLKGATLNTIAAAQKIGGDAVVLVAGSGCDAAAKAAAAVPGVARVLKADALALPMRVDIDPPELFAEWLAARLHEARLRRGTAA